MEEEEIQTQPPCKFSRVSSNGRSSNTSKIGQKGGSFENQLLYPPDEEEDVELNKRPNLGTIVVSAAGGGGGDSGGAANRLRGWHHSSRIIRVSRASGGKDRHSKVWTSKGLRDRRVRLSVTTAIQFYDLQDRLGYDQPSKAVEWLIKAAADAINELPSLNGSNFPDTPKQLSDEKGFDSADVELEDPNFSQNQNQNQHFSLSKSACSSTSDTSKGSGLSLSRPDVRVSRVKARERARERTAKEKEKESHESSHIVHHQNVNNPISQNSTFTELLTGGISSVSNNNNNSAAAAATASPGSEANLFHNHNKGRQWPNLTPMDYFSTGLLGPTSSRTSHHSSGFQLGNSIHPQAMTMSIPPYSFSGENNHQEQLQHFPFLSDHLIPVATTTQQQQQQQGHGGDYNLNFTISSSGLSGFNRGTLQSNSSSSPSSFMPHHHHLQRFSSSSIDGSSNLPFFIGATAAPQPPPMENHHHNQQHHHHQFPPGLQLYGDGSRHSDHKGKGKN